MPDELQLSASIQKGLRRLAELGRQRPVMPASVDEESRLNRQKRELLELTGRVPQSRLQAADTERLAVAIRKDQRDLAELAGRAPMARAQVADSERLANEIRKGRRDLAELAGRAPMARAQVADSERLANEIRKGRRDLADLAGRAPMARAQVADSERLAAELERSGATLAELAGKVAPRQPSQTGGEIPALLRTAPETGQSRAIWLIKNSLNGGEIAAELAARGDQARFQNGCLRLLNMVPLATGGVTKRPGFVHVASAKAATGRLFSFVFSASESRICEFYAKGSSCGLRIFKPDKSSHDTGLTLPWQPDWLKDVCFCQSADVIFVSHPKFAPAKIMRHSDTDWRYETIKWGPAIQPPKVTGIATAGTWPQGNTTYMMRQYAVTAVDEDGNESAPNTDPVIWGIPPLTQSFYVTIGIEAVEGAAEYRFYKYEAGVYGYIGRMESAETLFEDRNIAADTEDTPPGHKNPFSGPGKYPACVFLHQQRLGFAASNEKPLTVWLSQSGNYESQAASLPPRDDDAIEATLAASQANRILWAVSDRGSLAIGTEGGEWLLDPADGGALTPRNISFQPQTSWGSQPGIYPLAAGSGLVFLQRGGQVLRSLGYNFQDDKYRATDLTLMARHILAGDPVRAWCWQPEPHGIIWSCCESGSLAALTWLPEHEVIAWHRHSTAGKVLDLAAIPGPDGNTQVWTRCERQGNVYIEMLGEFSGPMRQPLPEILPVSLNNQSLNAADSGNAPIETGQQAIPDNAGQSLQSIADNPGQVDTVIQSIGDDPGLDDTPRQYINDNPGLENTAVQSSGDNSAQISLTDSGQISDESSGQSIADNPGQEDTAAQSTDDNPEQEDTAVQSPDDNPGAEDTAAQSGGLNTGPAPDPDNSQIPLPVNPYPPEYGYDPLPLPASHKDGIFETAYPCRIIPCLDIPANSQGAGLMSREKLNYLKVQVCQSFPFRARVLSQYGQPGQLVKIPARHSGFAARAVWGAPLMAGFRDGSLLEIICDGPEPVTILALAAACEIVTDAGLQG